MKTVKTLFLLMVVVTSCYYDKEETLYGRAVDCSSTNHTYSTDVGALITQNCATSGCHDAANAGNVKLQSYSQAVEHSARINQRAVIERTMPPGGLTAEQIAAVRCWIANGTPN